MTVPQRIRRRSSDLPFLRTATRRTAGRPTKNQYRAVRPPGAKIKESMRYVWMLGLTVGLAFNASAWGGKGHRMIASLAEKRLAMKHPSVMKRIETLLGPGVSLASLAVCADSIRDYVSGRNRPDATYPGYCLLSEQEAVTRFPNTGSWHFVNIPVPAGPNPSAHKNSVLRDACAANAPCILSQIEHFERQLKDKRLDKPSRAIALMFLVHLVGDLHQPLHAVARNNDKGGNEVFVRVGAHTGRLHGLWDSFLVEPLQDDDVAEVRVRAHGRPDHWAWESYDASRLTVYAAIPVQPSTFENPIVLPDPAYRDAAIPVVKRRLRQASLRLADLLAKALAN